MIARSTLPFSVGESILIRTVTMILLGRVRAIAPDYVVLENGGWVADVGRLGHALASGEVIEYEIGTSWTLVAWASVIDIWPWNHDLPRTTI